MRRLSCAFVVCIWHNRFSHDIAHTNKRLTKMLIRLHGCASWSVSLLFTYGINRFSHDVAHFMFTLPSVTVYIIKMCITEVKSDLSRLMSKPAKWSVRPAKTQISLGIRPVWSESSLCAEWVAKDPSFLHAHRQVSDQTGQMRRLIWTFAGCTCHFVGFVKRRLEYV